MIKNYEKCIRLIILPFDLYGFETLCFIVTGEHRRWVFEDRELRKIFINKRNAVVAGQRK
jgi:hypothetical protein